MTQEKTVHLERFEPLCGWRNRILRVDLSEGRIWAQQTAPYVPDYLGGRGLAAKILWDEYPEPVGSLAPENPFMVMPGTLTGTSSPYSGRTSVCAFAPQAYPYEWFTRASIGARWGHDLKRAGYDGVVVTGASEEPVHVLIRDDEVSILAADDLWGLDAIAVQEAIQDEHGRRVRVLTMGPAGENLSRISTVHTDTTSVAGQGGFGAVMGSKKLKAVSVLGTGQVPVADPGRLRHLFKAVGDEMRDVRGRRGHIDALNEELASEGARARLSPCTASCPTPCRLHISGMKSTLSEGKVSGDMLCVSGLFGGSDRHYVYDWEVGFRGGFELNMLANRLGLNHWELLVGIVPWLRICEREGLLQEFNGRPLDWNSVEFWAQFLEDIAYHRGMGDALAEGGVRAASILGLGEEFMRRYYTGWGYAGHWDGHACFSNHIVYPFWLVGALHWAMDTRDPASSAHGYVQNVMYWGPFTQVYHNEDAPITWDHMREIGERIYGRADTLDPTSGYEGKAIPAAYHAVRSVMKDCLPTDDQVFPLIYSYNSEDRFCRIGNIDGPDVDSHLFRAGTGVEWDTAEFEHAAERVLNLERANVVRHWGRDREMDQRVLPSFAYDENWVNPKIGEHKALDIQRFMPVMDEYYRLRGWDVETGWPTRARLEAIGLDHVYEEMMEGARRAKKRLPELPAQKPVRDIHQHDPERTGDSADGSKET
ncbi:MAG: aldehyde ferredoxin oxidoreductase N-terminal domain-containing protein [Anaerolineae bacterium]